VISDILYVVCAFGWFSEENIDKLLRFIPLYCQ